MAKNDTDRIRRYVDYAKTYSHRPSTLLVFSMLGDWGVVYGLFVLITGIMLVAFLDTPSMDVVVLAFLVLQLLIMWSLCHLWKRRLLRKIGDIKDLRFDPSNPQPGQICEAIAAPSSDFLQTLDKLAVSGRTPDPVATVFRVIGVNSGETAELQIIRTSNNEAMGLVVSGIRWADLRSIER